MYWNAEKIPMSEAYAMININMRCIEMERKGIDLLDMLRLTLTWDVLKFYCIS